MIYLDNAATTKPCDAAKTAACEMLEKNWHNPSSLYTLGMYAQDKIDAARESVAKLLSCKEKNIVFTSGGTESNNIAVHSAILSNHHVGKRIVASAYEHSSIYENLLSLQTKGYEVEFIYPEPDGTISPEKVENAVDDKTALVLVMLSNNEIGALNDLSTIVKKVKAKNKKTLVHTDAVAIFGKMPINAVSLGVDTLSVSAHKVHALKGCGALYFKDGVSVKPLFIGGEQEKKIRPGTENAPAIAAFGAACEEIRKNITSSLSKARELKQRINERVLELPFVKINAQNDFPFVTNICVEGIRSEILLHFLEKQGIYISSGSACSRGKKSHVLKALGLSDDIIDSSVRISLSHNEVSDIDALFDSIILAEKSVLKR